jgi:hypothetical protein
MREGCGVGGDISLSFFVYCGMVMGHNLYIYDTSNTELCLFFVCCSIINYNVCIQVMSLTIDNISQDFLLYSYLPPSHRKLCAKKKKDTSLLLQRTFSVKFVSNQQCRRAIWHWTHIRLPS